MTTAEEGRLGDHVVIEPESDDRSVRALGVTTADWQAHLFANAAGTPAPPESRARDVSPKSSPSRPLGGRRRRISLWSALGAGVIGLAIVVTLAVSPPATTIEAKTPLLGKMAPSISGSTIVGKSFDLVALRGHFVVVDFFASWCAACRAEQPQLNQFVAEHEGPRGPRLVGVIFDDTVANIRAWLGPVVHLYPMITDPDGQLAINYGVDNPPMKFLIGPTGRVLAKIVGPVTAAGLDGLIATAQRDGA